jgi:hypothetical protein
MIVERGRIAILHDLEWNYRTYHNSDIRYAARPNGANSYRNSNSWTAGLIKAAGLPMPTFPNPVDYPGWTLPVGDQYFRPPQ